MLGRKSPSEEEEGLFSHLAAAAGTLGLIAIRIVVIGSAVSSWGFVDVRLATLDQACCSQLTSVKGDPRAQCRLVVDKSTPCGSGILVNSQYSSGSNERADDRCRSLIRVASLVVLGISGPDIVASVDHVALSLEPCDGIHDGTLL